MGWLVGVVGIVVTLTSAFRTETNGLLVAEVIAVFAWLWALHERYRMPQKVGEIQSKIKKLEDEYQKILKNPTELRSTVISSRKESREPSSYSDLRT